MSSKSKNSNSKIRSHSKRPIHKIKHPKASGKFSRFNSDVTGFLKVPSHDSFDSHEGGWKNSTDNLYSVTSMSNISLSKFRNDKK